MATKMVFTLREHRDNFWEPIADGLVLFDSVAVEPPNGYTIHDLVITRGHNPGVKLAVAYDPAKVWVAEYDEIIGNDIGRVNLPAGWQELGRWSDDAALAPPLSLYWRSKGPGFQNTN